jgi:predicted nucleic acid-binding protein
MIQVDTSVFSAYYDDRATDRQEETEGLWGRLGEFEVSTCDLTLEELALTPDPGKRASLQDLLKGIIIHPITEQMRILARQYINRGVFSALTLNDALHVAAAVLTRQDVLISWNFKHLVNRRRRAKINEVNISLDLPTIDIVAPPEI